MRGARPRRAESPAKGLTTTRGDTRGQRGARSPRTWPQVPPLENTQGQTPKWVPGAPKPPAQVKRAYNRRVPRPADLTSVRLGDAETV